MQFFRGVVIFGFLLLILSSSRTLAASDERLVYHLRYDLFTPGTVHITLNIPPGTDGSLTLIMPRSVPGGYAQRPYDPFVMNVKGYSASVVAGVEQDEFGPRWTIGKRGAHVDRIEYDVDVARMEREILAASDTSKVRDGYVGLLGYSVFAFIVGLEKCPVDLEVTAPANWPVFSTLAPKVPAEIASLKTQAPDYYALADAQVMMGPKLHLQKVNGITPLFVSAYSESDADLTLEGKLARAALEKVIAYFGKAPFSEYTVVLEFLRPVSPQHKYNFSMEHLNSGTFYLDAQHALTTESGDSEKEAHQFNYAHHIAHSWIPKQVYGAGYLPFTWEMTPVIDTIWFNEGFGRYVAIAALADALPKGEAAGYRKQKLARLEQLSAETPEFLQRMRLDELSREGSFLYAEDFRVGISLFSRGALMAGEMDERIRAQTDGQKSLRDALCHLMDWSDKHHRPFRVDELPVIFHEATGVNTADILDRWMQAPLQRSVSPSLAPSMH